MASLSPSSSALELSIRALEVLRNFLHTEGASIIDVERHLVAFYPEWSFDSELTELFASIIECEPDDLDKFSQINAAIDAKVESLTFELYTRASPGPLTENAIEEPRSLHILPTLDVQSSSDAVNPSLLAVHPSSSKTLASSDQSTPVSSPSKNRLTLKEYAQRKKDRTVSQMVATAATPSSLVVPADDLSGDINVDLAFVGLFPILDAATSNSPPPSSAQADTSAIVVTPIVGPNTQTISSAISSAEGISESHANDIRSMDGRFGAILIDKDIVVTTPNANVIYAPRSNNSSLSDTYATLLQFR
ncbi:hypothetical protein F5878DRAFT_667729 [Lentinula raphanica]|uniref:Uncharacterized protein n=1 Tax=Lentinula raphanica TaxID=153919 RepID=A0AA38NVC2_9AGAR|nr:hypothetical protein F5878DRAFT_667729 [Lentinula raphanica]